MSIAQGAPAEKLRAKVVICEDRRMQQPRSWFWASLMLCLLAVSGWPEAALAKRTKILARLPTLPAALRRSHSIGAPWQGRLSRGVRLEPGDTLRYVTEYANTGHFYGTWELVQLIQRAAHRVSIKHPGAKLSVGELSAAGGGDLPGHASHENGRDADLSFYMLDAQGRPYSPYAFANFDGQGRGLAPNQGLSFDTPRNWELIQRLITDGDARVQFVFVAPAIKQLLLAYAKGAHVSDAILQRAARVMVRPNEKHPHGNHFHLRVYCSRLDRPKCKDRAPYWPWYPGSPVY